MSIVCDQKVIIKCYNLYSTTCSGCGLYWTCGLIVEVLAGMSKEGCRCCSTKWCCEIGSNEILLCGKDGDVEQVARISKQFSRVSDCSIFSQLYSTYLCLYISCLLAHNYLSFMLDIVCILTLVWIKRLLKHLNSYSRWIIRRSSRALYRKFSFTSSLLFV